MNPHRALSEMRCRMGRPRQPTRGVMRNVCTSRPCCCCCYLIRMILTKIVQRGPQIGETIAFGRINSSRPSSRIPQNNNHSSVVNNGPVSLYQVGLARTYCSLLIKIQSGSYGAGDTESGAPQLSGWTPQSTSHPAAPTSLSTNLDNNPSQ